MVEYTHSCGPLQNLLKQVKELEEQQRETERLQKEKDERVSLINGGVEVL